MFKIGQIKKDLKRFRNYPIIFKRLSVLLESTRYAHLCTVLTRHGVSERSFYRWKKAYLAHGVEGLMDLKGRGRKKTPIRGRLAKRIKQMRKRYLWGAEVIQAHLKHDHGIIISKDRIHRYIKDQGLIEVKRKRKKKSKHTKVVKIYRPGQWTQIDVKHLTDIKPGKRLYAYNFVDHASKWSYKRIFDSYGPFETKCFVLEVLLKAPFFIECIQSDNGIEFTNRFVSDPLDPKPHALDIICHEQGIRHKLIPVGEKEINGLVEKHHHMDFKECYRHINTLDLNKANTHLQAHCTWRNAHRRYKSLGWLTPNQYLRAWKEISQDLTHCFDKETKKAA